MIAPKESKVERNRAARLACGRGPAAMSRTRRGSLLALLHFAIMRRKRHLAVSALVGALLLAPCRARAAEPDSTGDWIPSDPSELESPDRLEERDPGPGAGVRWDWRQGRRRPKHLWIEGTAPAIGAARVEWMARSEGALTDGATLRILPAPGIELAAGAIVARRPPALFGEALGLSRPLRAPKSPVLCAPGLEAPRGASSPAVRGAAAEARRGGVSAWGLAGRGNEDEAIRAGGITARQGPLAGAIVAGEIRGARRAGSVAARWTAGGSRFAVESLFSPGRGPELLAEAARAAGWLAVEARWRRRPLGSGEARPVAAELALHAGSGAVRTRFTWRPWSARAPGDDGRVELETTLRETGRGPARVRLGSRGGEADGMAATPNRTERYVIADIGIAREGGRSLALLVSARETRRAGAGAIASAMGGRLTISERGRSGAVLVMQARRSVLRGGSPSEAPAAWTAAIAPSGAETLASRSGSGIVASGRAWVRLGGFRLEALVSDAAAPEGERSSAGSLRIEWGRGDR
jgi:hypothetical protein